MISPVLLHSQNFVPLRLHESGEETIIRIKILTLCLVKEDKKFSTSHKYPHLLSVSDPEREAVVLPRLGHVILVAIFRAIWDSAPLTPKV